MRTQIKDSNFDFDVAPPALPAAEFTKLFCFDKVKHHPVQDITATIPGGPLKLVYFFLW